AELATGHAGDAAAVDEGLAREHRLGEGGLSREPVECLCEVDAPLAVRVGRPVAAVVRPRVERARSVPGKVDAARVSGRGPGEDVRAQPGGRDFHGCRPCAPVVARARYKQAGITAAERELVPDDVQIAGAIDRQCDAADEGASSRRYCAVDAPEPAGHCPAESYPLASGDAHLIRSATLRRRGGVRNEDVVCGRADLWLAERAHRAGTGCNGERPERDTGLGALAPNWRARERQLVLRLSCR